jgi:hypothetical protein
MVLTHKTDLDLEGQNHGDPKDKFNYKSAEAVTISSELFEKVHTLGYKSNMAKLVQQKYPAAGAFTQKFANPTPLAFQG